VYRHVDGEPAFVKASAPNAEHMHSVLYGILARPARVDGRARRNSARQGASRLKTLGAMAPCIW